MPMVKMAPVDRAAIGRMDSPSEPSVGEDGFYLFIYSLLRRDTDTQSVGTGLEQSPELDQDQCDESVCGGY